MNVLQDVDRIVQNAIQATAPDEAVRKALAYLPRSQGKTILIAIGKAAWQMSASTCDTLDNRIAEGLVVTKYGHSQGPIGDLKIIEAGHPVPDENSYLAAEEAIRLVEALGENDLVLFLVSGGGSALFEKPLIPEEEIKDITRQLLACGANIIEINTLRKRLSAVKGGKFAKFASLQKFFQSFCPTPFGDPLDVIASARVSGRVNL